MAGIQHPPDGASFRGGDELRRLRRQRDLSQAGLADLSGVSERSIRDLESGRVDTPRPSTLRAVVRALDLTTTELATLLRPPPQVVALAEILQAPMLVLQTELASLHPSAVTDGWTSSLYLSHQVVGPHRHFERSRTERTITSTADELTHRLCLNQFDTGLSHRPRVEAEYGCTVSQEWVLPEYDLSVHELELGRPLARGDSASFGFSVIHDMGAEQLADAEVPRIFSIGSRSSVQNLGVNITFLAAPPSTVRPFEVDGATGQRVHSDPVLPDRTGTVHLTVRNTTPGRGYGFEWDW